jgi:hypothetical protein
LKAGDVKIPKKLARPGFTTKFYEPFLASCASEKWIRVVIRLAGSSTLFKGIDREESWGTISILEKAECHAFFT